MTENVEETRDHRLTVSADVQLFADGIRIPFRSGKNGGYLTFRGVVGKENNHFTLTSGGPVVLVDENGQRSFTGRAGATLKVKA